MYTRRGHCIAQSRNRKINRFRPRIKKKKKKQRSEILNNATETGLLKETKKKKKKSRHRQNWRSAVVFWRVRNNI